MQPLAGLVDTARRSWRLGATVFVAFGVLTLVVAAVGLYGMIGYNVAERRHELGVRVALGAERADVRAPHRPPGRSRGRRRLLVGVPLALVAARWVQPLLFEQSARDPFVYAAGRAPCARRAGRQRVACYACRGRGSESRVASDMTSAPGTPGRT